MSLIWDAKNNFILTHSITRHKQRSAMETINWSSVVNDIRLEISSTPRSLQNQYEHLLETFHPQKQSTSLYTVTKHTYLRSICEKIENDLQVTLEALYELIRHARSKRIDVHDIEQLLKEWNFKSTSGEEQRNKERLLTILKRLRHYIQTLPDNHRRSASLEHGYAVDASAAQTTRQDEDLEPVSDSDDDQFPVVHKEYELPNSNRLTTDVTDKDKPLFTRRRTRSLTVSADRKDQQVNIGVEWFVPKFKRQQRSSSLHAQSPPTLATDESSLLQNHQLQSNGILLTTVDNDESSNSDDTTNVRRTRAQPSISWLPLTKQQVTEKDRPKTQLESVDDQQLDQVSSTDSESVEIQWSSESPNKTSELPSSHDLDDSQRENSSAKRQRLS